MNSVFCQAKCLGRPTNSGLNDHSLRRSNEFQTHGFVDNAAVARQQRQRVADVVRSRGDIEQQSDFARIGLLGEVQPEDMVPERLPRVLKKLALRQSGDATMTVVDIAF